MKSALERLRDTELDVHLGCKALPALAPDVETISDSDAPKNRRHGHAPKTVRGAWGEMQLDSVVVKGISTGKVIPGHTNFAEIQQTTRAALDALWVANADVPAVLKAVCARIQPML